MPDIHVNGIRLYYEERGSGAPILCIHGTSSSAMVWRDAAIAGLARLGRAIVYDRRGCTRSERPEPYTTSVAEHADDAAALIEAISVAPAVLIGRSYGGGVAVGVALRYPDRVRALVLLEAADIVSDEEPSAYELELVRIVEAAALADPASVGERFLRYLLGDAPWQSFPEKLKAMFADNSPAILAEIRGAPLEAKTEELSKIAVPTLLVAGADSPAALHRANERLASLLPDARSVVVGGGHLIDPAEPSVLGFLEDVVGG